MPPSEADDPHPHSTRVLLVDDERDLVHAYVRLLAVSGYECVGVFDLEQAIAKIDTERFDLLITDLSLARSSGLEIVRRARHKSPPLPVIVTTGHNTPDLVKAAETAGADTCLLKPVSITQLRSVIRETLSRHANDAAP
jgi:DNA-binding response OmpR family regulator